MPALYLITGTAHVFMAFAVFSDLSFDLSIAFNLFMYSFFIFSFISWCFIYSPSVIPKYLYPVSYMYLMLFPSGKCIPLVLVTLPLWMLTSAHFSNPNSILMSPETIHTVWTNVSISLVLLQNSLMSSMNIRWLILLPPFLSWYPTSNFSRTLCHWNHCYYEEQWR